MSYESNSIHEVCNEHESSKETTDSKCDYEESNNEESFESIEEWNDIFGHQTSSLCFKDNISDSIVMFAESCITVKEIYLMILAISFRRNLSKETRFDLMKMITILAGSRFHNLRTSKYIIDSLVPSNDSFFYIFYCRKCYSALTKHLLKSNIKKKEVECRKCNQKDFISLNSNNRILYLDIEFQFKTLLKNSEIVDDLMSNIQSIKNKSQANFCMSDVYDSKIYQKTLQNCKFYNEENCIT